MDEDIVELDLIDDYLANLTNPFDFLAKQSLEKEGKSLTD